MKDPATLERTRRDYDQVAREYDDLVRNDESSTHLLSTALITVFAGMVHAHAADGEVVDVGCGPGQWTEHLDSLGVRAHGIDLSPEMIAIARRHRPDLRYTVSSMTEIQAENGSLGGVLAHFSIIHLPPELLPAALAEFARVLQPGAPLLVGFQVADLDPDATGWVSYDQHRASPSYRWTPDAMAGHLDRHGFSEVARVRIEPLVAERPPPGYLLTTYRPAQPGT